MRKLSYWIFTNVIIRVVRLINLRTWLDLYDEAAAKMFEAGYGVETVARDLEISRDCVYDIAMYLRETQNERFKTFKAFQRPEAN